MKRLEEKPIICHVCRDGYGTLIKVDENLYRHQDQKICNANLVRKREK